MRAITITIIICCGLMISCYKPFTSNIDANEKVLVVEGMITNEIASYKIHLSYATPFNNEDTRQYMNSANVYVVDDLGNNYPFLNSDNGYYLSDSLHFSGHPGRIYTLHIETADNEIYISDPQHLRQVFYPSSVYAEAVNQQTLSSYSGLVSTVHGANVVLDIKSGLDTLPRFRFTSNLVNQYTYIVLKGMIDYQFYAWQTDKTLMDINLTGNEYSLSSSDIVKHAVYFVDDNFYFQGLIYKLGPLQTDLTYIALPTINRQSYLISHRILYLNQYSLNNETYLYYKSMDEQLRSDGKLFDPIAVQLTGNIKCTTNPAKKTFGFFEASSVSRISYEIGFRGSNDQYSVKKMPYILPSEPDGCWINKVPSFWGH
jgi:hypothetical protein